MGTRILPRCAVLIRRTWREIRALPFSGNGDAELSETNLDARFIEQEHRVIPIVQNFWESRRFRPGDPRRKAAVRAAIFKIFAPGHIALIGGGVIAFLSVVILAWQTLLIKDQNTAFREQNTALIDQNKKIQVQVDQQAAQFTRQRRTELIEALYEGIENETPTVNPRTRKEAVLEFISISRSEQPNQPVDLKGAQLNGVYFFGADLSGVDFSGANLQNARFVDSNCDRCTFDRASLEGTTTFEQTTVRSSSFLGAKFGYKHETFRCVDLRWSLFSQTIRDHAGTHFNANVGGAWIAPFNTDPAESVFGKPWKLLSSELVEKSGGAVDDESMSWDVFKERLQAQNGDIVPALQFKK